MTDLLCEVETIAVKLVESGHRHSPACLRQLIELARQQNQVIQSQRQEIIDMARTNQQNLDVVLGALKDAKDAALTDDQKAALTGLATAANVITPDTTGARVVEGSGSVADGAAITQP